MKNSPPCKLHLGPLIEAAPEETAGTEGIRKCRKGLC